jgi:hypothetical protein
MRTADLTLSVCLARKRVLLTRRVVKCFGDPSHLSFWYDEANGCLIISARAGPVRVFIVSIYGDVYQ